MKSLARRIVHTFVFHHRWRPSILLCELSGMTFAYEACELCFYYDPAKPLGVYAAQGTEVYRVVAADLHEGATVQ